MAIERHIYFDCFCLDLTGESLRRGSDAIKVRPKAYAVLAYLLERPGQLVTKEELLNAVWPETFVGEAVLKVTIRQLREALGDDPKSPRFIETVHRRGYRFVGQIAQGAQPLTEAQESGASVAGSLLSMTTGSNSGGVVGRDEAMLRMRAWLEKMLAGERQIIFVTGEAGIGKTALVDTFARGIASGLGIRIARGQCLEHYGTSEAYLPFLEAIARLCREQREVVDLLRAHAPMWLAQMPSLLSAPERELLSQEMLGATRERMLREMGEALEALTADQPLVLILEDLHWSDYSTLDLISYLARQRQPAQLMLIGTYRTVELLITGHPLKAVKQELLAKQQCEELRLEYLSEETIANYLSMRFPGHRFPNELARLIYQRTEGNPLFMVNAVDYLAAEGLIAEHGGRWELVGEIEKAELGVPDSIKQMIEKQLDHLSPEQRRTLEAASVAGAEFTTLAVMAESGEERETVEARCDELARQHQFIQDRGIQDLPNGEAVTRYGFIHALYQNVLYERLPVSRRIQLHRRIAEQWEALYGDRVSEIAAELAMHFERGSSARRAVKYLQQAAENDIRRFAYREAVGLARRGLELLERLPDTPERARQELQLCITLGVPLIAIEGYAAPEVVAVYSRARELCEQLGVTQEISQVLWGLRTFYTVKAELGTARDIAEEFLRLAGRLPYPGLAMRGHWALQITFMHLGEFARAIDHFDKALSLYDPEEHTDDAVLYAQNPGVAMRCFAAWTLWFHGRPDQALKRIDEAVKLARELGEPNGLAPAFFFGAILHQLRGEERLAREFAETAFRVSSEHGLVLYEAMATIARGWALTTQGVQQEAIEQMQTGLASHRATGTEVLCPHFLALLGEAIGRLGAIDDGLQLLEEALEMTRRNGERYYQAELYRVKGELLLMRARAGGLAAHEGSAVAKGGSGVVNAKRSAVAHARGPRIAETNGAAVAEVKGSGVAEAECFFKQSIEVAREQQAKAWELRAVTSLGRLYQSQGRGSDARNILAPVYSGFSEGFDTVDLREAKALLDELA